MQLALNTDAKENNGFVPFLLSDKTILTYGHHVQYYKYFDVFSEENSCAQEMLSSWLEKVEIENEMAKMALPLLQKVINKCLIWFSAHKSDVITEVYNISVVCIVYSHNPR